MSKPIDLTRSQLINIAEAVTAKKQKKYGNAGVRVNPDIEWCDVQDIVNMINDIERAIENVRS